jgi:hypothetical protein
MLSQNSDGALPVTARRAKRENGGLGEDPPGSTMTYGQVKTPEAHTTLGLYPTFRPAAPTFRRVSAKRVSVHKTGLCTSNQQTGRFKQISA